MFTATSLDVWEWFKFESIYEQLYNDIIAIEKKEDEISGLKRPTIPKFLIGFGLAISQVFILICPFLIFGKYGSSKNSIQLVSLNVDLITKNSKNNLYSGLSARSIDQIGTSI